MPAPRTSRPALLADSPAPEPNRLEEPSLAPVAEAPKVETAPAYPVIYYNPRIPDERFFIIGSPYKARFANGRFVAQNDVMEQSVRAALAAHGPDKPDRWRGEDRKQPWTDRRTGFTTYNDNAKYDFELYHEN